MNNKPNDGPAFPMQVIASPNSEIQYGMSLRAYIATAALQGLLGNGSLKWDQDKVCSTYSDASVKLADALIAELNKEGK